MSIPPNKERYGNEHQLWLWLFLFIAILMVVLMITEQTKVIFSILGYDITNVALVTFVLGIVATLVTIIATHYINKLLNRSPKRIFDSHIGYTVDDLDSKLDRKVILDTGGIYNLYYFIQPKKLCQDIERIGVRPQINLPFWKRIFKEYNLKTDNIKNNSIVIDSITDVTPKFGESFDYDKDDGVCGRWGYYKPVVKLVPGRYLILKVTVNAINKWNGYINFRTDTPEGRRVVRHKVVIREVRNERNNKQPQV